MLLELAAIGLFLGVTSDVFDAFQRELASPIGNRLQRVLDRAVASRRSSYPGSVFYVDSESSGVWSGAAGLANTETGEPMMADNCFCIGSITKTLISTVVLQLMEEDVIDLDASIDTYLPEDLPVAIPCSLAGEQGPAPADGARIRPDGSVSSASL